MRMKIDEAEQYLIALKHCETCEANDANTCKTCEYHQKGSSAKCYDSIDVAIETMRKYQKIEQILKEPCIIPEGCYPMLNKIKRVVKEDGNVYSQ